MEYVSVAKFAYDVFKDVYRYRNKFIDAPAQDDTAIQRHVSELENWSRTVSLFGMVTPVETVEATIGIGLSDRPRRFTDKKGKIYPEEYVLEINGSSLVLGDPGSGKTTFAKRLIRRVITTAPDSDRDTVAFPIALFGRDLVPASSLFHEIFLKLGFRVKGQFKAGTASASDMKEWYSRGDREIRDAVIAGLTNAHALVLIDGVDEIPPDSRSRFENDLIELHRNIGNSRIVVTCRSGDWNRSIDFNFLQLSPLSSSDISDVVRRWAEDSDRFMSALENIPYNDLLDRPLFLTMLLVVYNLTGALPEQPVDVYYRLVNLVIERWDITRGIRRKSRYDGFGTERKTKFLSAIAFHLLAKQGLQRFASRALNLAYHDIGDLFALPPDESEYVVGEIESHTGIIVQAGFDLFEFSHLTLHEFLAANYLVGMSDFRTAAETMTNSPATVAVAACLSSAPSRFVGQVLLRYVNVLETRSHHELVIQFKAAESFFARLKLEKPVITPDRALGAAILKLASLYGLVERDREEGVVVDWTKNNLSFLLDHPVARRCVNDFGGIAHLIDKNHGTLRIGFDTRLIEDTLYEREQVLNFTPEAAAALRKREMLPKLLGA